MICPIDVDNKDAVKNKKIDNDDDYDYNDYDIPANNQPVRVLDPKTAAKNNVINQTDASLSPRESISNQNSMSSGLI